MDTGSSWFWVVKKGCSSCHKVTNSFDYTASSTFKNQTKAIELNYLLGYAKGIQCSDVVGIGDSNQIKAKDQSFLLVDDEKNNTGFKPDGLFGLGFKQLTDGIPTLLESLKLQNVIKNSAFSIYLSDNKFSENQPDLSSVLMIDGYDLDKYANGNKFIYVDLINNKGY